MNKKSISIGLVLVLFIFVPHAFAQPIEWHNMPKTDNEAGEIFQLRFEIKADETTNYTITIEPNSDFSSVNGNLSMTKEIPVNATRTFIFDMKIENNLEDGKHPIPFKAYKDGVQFKSANIYVRAGQQTPGFELIIVLFAIILTLIFMKRK